MSFVIVAAFPVGPLNLSYCNHDRLENQGDRLS